MVGVHLVVVTLHVRLTTMVMKTCTGQEFVGMKQYDWLQNGFFTNWGTIAKTFPVENFKHGCQHDNIFFFGSSLEVKFVGQPQTLGQET